MPVEITTRSKHALERVRKIIVITSTPNITTRNTTYRDDWDLLLLLDPTQDTWKRWPCIDDEANPGTTYLHVNFSSLFLHVGTGASFAPMDWSSKNMQDCRNSKVHVCLVLFITSSRRASTRDSSDRIYAFLRFNRRWKRDVSSTVAFPPIVSASSERAAR